MGSEYGGTGPRRVPVQPKGVSALTNSDRVLLQNTTINGVEDPRMPEDPTRAALQGLLSYPKFPPPIYPFPPDDHDDTAGGGR